MTDISAKDEERAVSPIDLLWRNRNNKKDPVSPKYWKAQSAYQKACNMIKTYKKKRRASEEPRPNIDDEIKVRSDSIAEAKKASSILKDLSDSIETSGFSIEDRKGIEDHVDSLYYLSKILEIRQRLVLKMKSCNYRAAKKLAELGFELATSPWARALNSEDLGRSDDINYFRGSLFEIEAFQKLESRIFEVNSVFFDECGQLFGRALEHLERAVHDYRRSKKVHEDEETLCFVPKAWLNLLKFMARPSLEEVDSLLEFRHLQNTSQTVKNHFSLHRLGAVSERKKRAEKMAVYFSNTTMKVACWQIFSEVRSIVTSIEDFVKENRELITRLFAGTEIPKFGFKNGLQYYEEAENVTIEHFMYDVNKHLHNLLPPHPGQSDRSSIVVASEIYTKWKHEKIGAGFYSDVSDELAEHFVGTIEDKWSCLRTLRKDAGTFLEHLKSAIP